MENDIRLFIALQEIRDVAFQKALKYRFDPVLSKTHEGYLKLLNALLKTKAGYESEYEKETFVGVDGMLCQHWWSV